jgi:alcohol dehydrogenase, propanol-preferring
LEVRPSALASGRKRFSKRESFGKPLRLAEIDAPATGASEVVVKTRTSGVCHSDLHNINGDWPFVPNLPIVPGHEGVGTVEEMGQEVRG